MDHLIGIRLLSAMRPYHRYLTNKIQQNPSAGSSDSAHTNLFENQPFFAQKWSIFNEILTVNPRFEVHILAKSEGCILKIERMRASQILSRKIKRINIS